MSYGGKLFARVGPKGAIAFVRFNDTTAFRGLRYGFTIIWSCGGDRLPTGETGVATREDIREMIEEGMLFEISESTGPCPTASA